MSFFAEICDMVFHAGHRAVRRDEGMRRVNYAAWEQRKARRRCDEASTKNERALKLLQDTLEGGGDDGTDDT